MAWRIYALFVAMMVYSNRRIVQVDEDRLKFALAAGLSLGVMIFLIKFWLFKNGETTG